MTERDIVEVLHSCRPIYCNLHDKVYYALSEREQFLIGKFEIIWHDNTINPLPLIKRAGLSLYEYAFLGGYILIPEELEPVRI